jgi:signal transduction histidine kinase
LASPRPLRILVLDDSPADAKLMARELQHSGVALEWSWVSTEGDYVAALDPAIDVILADYSLPGFHAMAALEHLKRRNLEIPFIVVTGILGDETAADCIKQGATDYLLKDRLSRLGPAVSRAVEGRRAEAERARAEARLNASERRAAEALRKANLRLEKRVEERTRDLAEAYDNLQRQISERQKAEDQLRQSQKMESIGQLTGGVAHDFNNLLTSILGNLDLASRKDISESAARLLNRAIQSAERGARLTSQLLAFGRRQALDARPVDLNALIVALQPMLTSSLTPAVRIDLALAPGLWPAHADATQVEMALLNLAINARDAMPSGGGLTIATRNVPVADPTRPADLAAEGSDYIALAVSDDGTGMTREVAEHAFEPFFTTKDTGMGSGLGLSMVYGLAKQLGGTACIDSKPGHGASVSVYLPRAAAAIVATEAVDESPAEAARAHPRANPVLLVDDDTDVRDTTASSLREYGYDVIEADCAANALAILDRGCEIDVLVTDLVMPGMHGSELALNARLRRPGLPIILMTGYMGLLSEHADGEFSYPVLHKPFRPAQLAAMVADCRRGCTDAMAPSTGDASS